MLLDTPLASLNAFFIAYSQSDFFGKAILFSLFVLSMICWIILLYKIWEIKQVTTVSKTFQKAFDQIQEPLLNVDLTRLPQTSNKLTPHPYADIFQSLKYKTVEVLNKKHYFLSQSPSGKVAAYLTPDDLNLVESHAFITISHQNKKLEKNLFMLSTIATLAPFIGLLGTVWGILVTFAGLHEGGGISSNTAILGGISTALATTVLGLVIAIPALVSYNYLRSALKAYTSDMDDFLSLMLSKLELQYRKVD